MFIPRLKLGLIHVAVTITLIPITSTLNRIMIKEMAIPAITVALLVSLPYLFSPIQIVIGSYSDHHPFLGKRRTPYVLVGLIMCIVGVLLAPHAATMLDAGGVAGTVFAIMAFGLWGMGFNFATVAYFSLASELSPENGRSATIAFMFTMMVISLIVVGLLIAEIVRFSLPLAFWVTGGLAIGLGILGLLGLEPPADATVIVEERDSVAQMFNAIASNPQARLFFIYMILLLAAILGQDVLLEPFAGQAFGMDPAQTTRLSSISGVFFLLSMVAASPLQKQIGKVTVARIGGWSGVFAFATIILGGVSTSQAIFYVGLVLLGIATGLATVSNLSLMLDMTTVENVGLFMGAWGMASAVARLLGSISGALVRDVITFYTTLDLSVGYMVVFAIEIAYLLASLAMLKRIDVQAFKALAQDDRTAVDQAALMGEAGV